jgi:5S rRNA maturation endonuclease (ribonuclease M5)
MDTKSKEELRAKLETSGAKFSGSSACTCPFHRDTNPSAGIYQSKDGAWRFKCQVCDDTNMDIIGFEARLTGQTPEEVLRASDTKEQKSVITEQDIRTRYTKANGWKYLHEYTDTKGLVTHFVACKYEGERKKFLQMKRYGFNFTMGNSGKRPLFRLHKLAQQETVIIVEGEKCVLALEFVGFENVTTCMGGAKSVGNSDLSPLKGKRILIWPDNDEAGTAYANDLKAALDALDCKVGLVDIGQFMLSEKEDAADYVAKYLKDYTKAEIKSDIQGTLDSTRIDGYWETFNSGMVADLKSGVLKSLDIGWDLLSKTKWMLGGSVTTICAEPGIGKTWFVHNLAINAHRKGIKVANIQLEDTKDFHLARLMAAMLGIVVDPDEIRPSDFIALEQNRHLIDELSPLIICPAFEKCSLVNVASIVKEKAEAGCKLIIVDSVSVAEKSERSWDDDQRFINIVKREVSKHKIRLVLVTHPNNTQGKLPTLENLSGGKSYQRLSQAVLWLAKTKTNGSEFGDNPDEQQGNRVITMLKGRNAHERMESNSILFSFRHSQFHEIGFCSQSR